MKKRDKDRTEERKCNDNVMFFSDSEAFGTNHPV